MEVQGIRPVHGNGDPFLEQSQVRLPAPAPGKRGPRLAFLWSISGAVLSTLGFLALTLFQQYNDSINELRRDLKHFNESSADLVKKESLQRWRDKVIDCMKQLRDWTAIKADMEREMRSLQEERKEMTRELQKLRERLATLEGRQSVTAIILPGPAEKKANTPVEDRGPFPGIHPVSKAWPTGGDGD